MPAPTDTAVPPAKTGKLIFDCRKPIGWEGPYDFYKCVDCGTLYRMEPYQGIQCNGASIGLCPWCRPDSAPWKNGRGK